MRARHENQIKRYNRIVAASSYDDAARIFAKKHGLSWFTDEQIADIRRELISQEWSRYRFYRDQRRRAA